MQVAMAKLVERTGVLMLRLAKRKRPATAVVRFARREPPAAR
jgi:hypothetical protein